jgi:hypothetical protein
MMRFEQFSGIHVASYFGIHEIVQCLAGGPKVNTRDEKYKTQLLWAASKGYEVVVWLLLNWSDVDADDRYD